MSFYVEYERDLDFYHLNTDIFDFSTYTIPMFEYVPHTLLIKFMIPNFVSKIYFEDNLVYYEYKSALDSMTRISLIFRASSTLFIYSSLMNNIMSLSWKRGRRSVEKRDQ